MKTCPTCGQLILPSMGKRAERLTTAPKSRNDTVAPANLTITLKINNQTHKLDVTLLPRGYRATKILNIAGHRHRINIQILHYPRRSALGGTIKTIKLANKLAATDKEETQTTIPDQETTYPELPLSHEWPLTLTISQEPKPQEATLTLTAQ